MTSVFGYIIAHRELTDEQKLGSGMKTLGFTIGEAWIRHVGFSGPDTYTIVQRWNERGYGPHRVELSLAPLPELPLSDDQKAALHDALASMEGNK